MAVVFPPENYNPTPSNALLAKGLAREEREGERGEVRERRSAWVQLVGHLGNFAPASHVTLWKRQLCHNSAETSCYRAFQHDPIRSFMPLFLREVLFEQHYFIEIEDLLQNFDAPSIMDIKMGTRTFSESEVGSGVMRGDLYDKLVSIDPLHPTPHEHHLRKVTKLRYMQFRENLSSSTNLGFRIEAVKMEDQHTELDWKKTKTEKEVMEALRSYLHHSCSLCKSFLTHLTSLRTHLKASDIFNSHEIVGSSLLLMHDQSMATGVWLIDFSKSLPLTPPISKITHRLPWQAGNHEDGYLFGLDNLISIMSALCSETTSKQQGRSQKAS